MTRSSSACSKLEPEGKHKPCSNKELEMQFYPAQQVESLGTLADTTPGLPAAQHNGTHPPEDSRQLYSEMLPCGLFQGMHIGLKIRPVEFAAKLPSTQSGFDQPHPF